MLTKRKDDVLKLQLLADLAEARATAKLMGNHFIEYLITMAELEASDANPEKRETQIPEVYGQCLREGFRRL